MTTTLAVLGEINALKVANTLVRNSAKFTLEPEPYDVWRLEIKVHAQYLVNEWCATPEQVATWLHDQGADNDD